MNKIVITLILGIFLSFSAFSQLTLCVDMQNETVDPGGVSVAGSFQSQTTGTDWIPGVDFLTDPDMDNVYCATFVVTDGTYDYKFINGTAWDQDESVPAPCEVFTNRQIVVSGGTSAPTVCFGSCNACGYVAPTYVVTFQVDMSNETVDTGGVSIAGNFQGWSPGVDFLSPIGGGIYSITLTVPSGIAEYKFINGTAWGQDENSIPGTCANGGGNREYNVIADATVPVVCFNQCVACNVMVPMYDVKFQVNMANEIVNASGVSVAGSFQGWTPGSTLLSDANSDDIYDVTVSMAAGTYEFKYVNGITGAGYENGIPTSCTSGVYGNRFFTVSADTCLPEVCFEECADCITSISGSCSNGGYEYADIATILQTNCSNTAGGGSCHTTNTSGFNLSGYSSLLASGVNCGPIVTPGDTALSSLIQKTKWVAGGTAPVCGSPMPLGAASPLSPAEFNAINQWVLDGADEYCPIILDRNITFCVDMSCSGLTYSGVFVSGTFNGWDASIDSLTDDGYGADLVANDGIYCKTVVVPDGTHEYKFQTDGFTNSESFSGLELCPTNENTNRELTVSADATVAYAWNSCETDCSVYVPDYNITFEVNMCEAIDTGTFDPATQAVFVAGGNANQSDYGNNCGAAMTDADEDGTYVLTNSYPNGYGIIYKYYIGSLSDAGTGNCNVGANFEPSLTTCGFGGFGDRSYTVNGSDDTLGPFCFGSCSDCVGGTCDNASCVSVLHVSDPYVAYTFQSIPAGVYEADDILTSDGTVTNVSGGSVTFHAGDEYIELQVGFYTSGEVDFIAEIVDCDLAN